MKLKPVWLLLVLTILLLLSLILSSVPKVPTYQARTYYYWVAELGKYQREYNGAEVEKASAAIRAMGTNALPWVMADLRARAGMKDRVISWLAPRAPFLNLKPANVSERWVRGIRAMEVLGPLGKAYLPELVTMASNSTGYAESALIAIGPDALPAFTNLLAHSRFPQTGNLIGAFANAVYASRIAPEAGAVALPCLIQVFQSTDGHGRWYAASALGAVHQDPELCVPLLIGGLTDPTPSVRESCVQSLGAFGEAASAHAGKLAETFDKVDALTRRAICSTFGNFHSAAAVCVPVLVRGASDSNESVRVAAVVSLGQLGSQPELAIPALSRAAEDPSRVERMMAVQALGQFGPQATNALPILEGACSDPDASLRTVATNALNRVRLAN